jgi:hypothetical protein
MRNEDKDFRPIGTLLSEAVASLKDSGSTPTQHSTNSATTGRPEQPAEPSSIGKLPSVFGVDTKPNGPNRTATGNSLQSTSSTSALALRQSHSRQRGELVSRLLSHFWTSDDHPTSRQAQIEDWLEDLDDYTPQQVEDACRKWRRSSSRRPTPHDIRKLIGADDMEHLPTDWLPSDECQSYYRSCADRYRLKGKVCSDRCRT